MNRVSASLSPFTRSTTGAPLAQRKVATATAQKTPAVKISGWQAKDATRTNSTSATKTASVVSTVSEWKK
jgi:hypothetical protein